MAWLRKGDNSATHPLVMALATVRGSDERLMNEAYGFVQRCAEQSAGHMTDGVIDQGTAMLMGGPTRWRALVKACLEAGLLRQRGTGKDAVYLVPEDADFIHIRRKAEVEWERQRARDNSNPDLTVPVRLRDGDACRYCQKVVNWKQRRGRRAGTYDHREPGKAARVDTLVVSCGGCNSERLRRPDADTTHPLKPVPSDPIYGPETVKFLAGHGETVTPSSDPAPSRAPHTPTRPGTQPDTAATPATTQPAGHRAPDEDVRPDELDTAAGKGATHADRPRTPWERPAGADNAPDFATHGAGHRTPRERPDVVDTASNGEGHGTATPGSSCRSSQIGGLRPGSGRDGDGSGPGLVGSGASPPGESSSAAKRKRARRGKAQP